MKHDPIPADVRRLLHACLSSVSEVETLVLLVRTGRRWSAHEVAQKFVLDKEHTTLLLDALVRAGLVRRTGASYEFAPAGDEDRMAAEELAFLYPRYRTRIMTIVLARSR